MSEKSNPDGKKSIRVLLLEDNPADAELSLRQLRRAGFKVDHDLATTSSEFIERVRSRSYDIILADYRLPDCTGVDAFQRLRSEGFSTPFILVSGTLGDDVAVECIKIGITDYVIKDRLQRLPVAVQRALAEYKALQERRRIEGELKESEKHYRLLFETNPHPMWVFDAESFEILEVNEAALLNYGYSRSEFLSMTILDLRPREDVPQVRRSVESRRHGRLAGERWRHYKRDGTLIDVEITSHDILFHSRQAILAQAQDITERKRNEEKLRLSEERFSKAFRSSPLAITISTKADGRFVDVNEAFQRMTGFGWQELVGHSTIELSIWALPDERRKMIELLERDGQISTFETVVNSKTGGKRSVQISAEPISLNGTACILAVTNDVTEAKSLEAQFRQAQKMEAVGRLAGGIAHDFNNMLSVVTGYSELALDQLEPESPVRQRLTQIKGAAHRAAALTRKLLAFSRQQVLQPTILDLNTVVKDLRDMLQRVLSEDTSLRFELGSSLGYVNADRAQFEQVLMNLAVNARDAMATGGEIVIETANVDLDDLYAATHPTLVPGPYVLLSFSDTGCGMDSQTLSKIFEPFYTTKPQGKGTGLGLAMVYGFVQQSGGHIWVYTEPAKGTTFKIYLPRVNGTTDTTTETAPHSPSTRGWETILVVEDEAALRDLTAELLESAGYKVLKAEDGRSAQEIAAQTQQSIDVLLTDIILPVMSGVELAAQLRAIRPNLKVLYMSGYAGSQTSRHGVGENEAFVEKPFTKDSLLRRVRDVID
jgi:PAS domain S-box-containing protein